MSDADGRAAIAAFVGDHADEWDLAGEIPRDGLQELGKQGLLCVEVGETYGGLGTPSVDSGPFTAYVGSLCSSLRSVMTSQGMAAWTIQRLADAEQRKTYLPQLTSGQLAAVGFSEPDAGSDLGALTTTIRPDGDEVVLNGNKVWVTGAYYADLLVIIGKYEDGAAAVVVPARAPGVHVSRVEAPMGCRAAGHANITLDEVRLPMSTVLGGGGQPLPLLVTTALAYGRMSVAWGCVGIVRACLNAAVEHAKTRQQFGKPIAEHQLVAKHLADMLIAEQVATRACEHASRCWDSNSPDVVMSTVLAKHIGATQAAHASATAVQVLASRGARDGHVVARAYRDAKLMEIIEGSNEICEMMLAQHALATTG